MKNNLSLEVLNLTYESLGARRDKLQKVLKVIDRTMTASQHTEVRSEIRDLDIAIKAIDKLIGLHNTESNQPGIDFHEHVKSINANCREFEGNGNLRLCATSNFDNEICVIAFRKGFEKSAEKILHDYVQQQIAKENVTNLLRDAIQQAEEFGLVHDEQGNAITGAVMTEHGIMLTKD